MWKKFCVSILSICILGGAALISGSLFAADESTLRFTENGKEHHYVNDEFSYTLSSDNHEEAILYVGGGELHGGAFTYQIPFHESADITISNIRKPGAYQGEVTAEVSSPSAGTKEISGVLSFMVYGIVYQNDTMIIEPKQSSKPETYGTLPNDINPVFTYTSDNEAIAVVDNEGNITALKEGTTNIHMVVFDGEAGSNKRLYESVLRLEVSTKKSPSAKPQIQKGEEHDFRFIQTQRVTAENTEKQKIGYIEHPQSGVYQYEINDKASKQYEIHDGELYVLGKQSKGKHSVKVLVKAQEITYEVTCDYEVSAEAKEQKEHFQFRYEGENVSSIVRPYQEGNNTFQITSNKNLDEVLFQLKEEEDAQYLNVSQTGNIIVKKISKQPIIVTAKWQDEYYECSIMIDKADQEIFLPANEVTVSPQDGRFDPLIQGRMGNGALVAKLVSTEECVALSYSEQGGLIIDPIKVGDAQIQIYNDGDDNYKKSNVITLLVHVKDAQVLNEEWLGNAEWLNIQGIAGQAGWFTSEVTLSLKKEAPAQKFHYADKSYQTLKWQDNGETVLPIAFINEQEIKSTIAKVTLKIDTHAPLISSISERKVADNAWKQFIDELTFQSVYGEGMMIEINADDTLMNSDIKTSGVKEISYRVYKMEDNKETLLVSGVQEGEAISLQVADTGVHKVCATAQDHAGNQGDEVCKVLEADSITQISAENAAIMLQSRVFNDDDRIFIRAVDDADISEIAPLFTKKEEITGIKGFQIEWQDHEKAIVNQVIQVTIPTIKQTQPTGYWVQRSGDTYKRIEAQNKPTAQILQLTSLEPIYYVETKHSATAGQLGLYLAKPNDVIKTPPNINNTEVTKVSFKPFTYADTDLHLVLYGAGAVLVVCFIILLIRSGREEY